MKSMIKKLQIVIYSRVFLWFVYFSFDFWSVIVLVFFGFCVFWGTLPFFLLLEPFSLCQDAGAHFNCAMLYVGMQCSSLYSW